ncbi:lamin tail domain-containing protein [Myxococcaceae bacterium GXIMD 01537]
MFALSTACGGAPESVDAPCARLLSGDLVITEYLNDPEGTDTGQEYVEVHNPTTGPVDLRGLTLYAARADGSQEKRYVFLDAVPVAAGDYMVLGDVRGGTSPSHVDLSYGDALGALGNSSGRLGLRCGERVVDEVPLAAPAKSGFARGYDGRLVPDSEGNDEPSRWCDAVAPFVGAVKGSPGVANPPCSSGPGTEVLDGGTPSKPEATDGGVDGGMGLSCVDRWTGKPRALRRPEPGSLVLTEYMADPGAAADVTGEWVEVLALREVDLNGVTLSNEGAGRTTLESALCLSLRAGAYGVLARSEHPAANGGLPSVLGTFSFNLANGAGSRALRLMLGTTLLDEVTYSTAAVSGASQQLDPSRRSPSQNDLTGSFCVAPVGARYGAGDRGTPGMENRPCAP